MFDRRRYLGGFAVFALVLLRLVIGWHFFREGAGKLEYDRHEGGFRLAFTSEGFLNQATGPLAEVYRSKAPDNHAARELLMSPRENKAVSEQAADETVNWAANDERRRSEASKKGELYEVEFPPTAPYLDWATRIAEDWHATLAEFKSVPGLTDEQQQQADKVLQDRLQQVKDYLAGEAEGITDYRHELWRLKNWREQPETGELPFHDERIAIKAAETNGKPAGWTKQLKEFESAYHDDLRALLTTEQREQAITVAKLDSALTDAREKSLRQVDVVVTVLTIAVGACLLLGLFTRLAAIFGALFLLMVIASQPPWLANSAPTMPQIIEFVSLLVLAGTGAGRWAGLDYFLYALFHRERG